MALFEVDKQAVKISSLKDKYIIPPFSILDAKSGYWMSRKQEWEAILKDRENNVRNTTARGNTPYINNFEKEDFKGAKSPGAGNISTFDPFLAEILVRWFTKSGWTVLDPFADGIVRGAVCSILNRDYLGIDISKEQVNHNEIQKQELNLHNINYICGDSDEVLLNLFPEYYDFLLTCPPYYNLEVYTNNKNDLSNSESYEKFIDKFSKIVKNCYNVLKDDSFAAIVVEEIRDNDGNFYGFVPDTIRAFTDAGFKYYNEIILENRIVSLGIRCPKYFEDSRKVGRHHQNVLIFYKGVGKPIRIGNFE